MDFDTEEKVEEGELDALGIKKKDDEHLDDGLVDAVTDDAAVDPDLLDPETDDTEKGVFGDDPELEAYMLGEENY